jgi:hypothetical protein
MEMTGRARTMLLVAQMLLTTAAVASGQEPESSFDALTGRLRIGQSIWVTDSTGHEVHGRLERLTSDGLVFKTTGLITLAAADVRLVRARDRDSIKNGALIGLGIGASLGTAWCIGAIADDSGDIDAGVECAEGFTTFPALGALLGLTVDALIPGTMRVVYRAIPAHSRATVTVAPWMFARAKGLRVVIAF